MNLTARLKLTLVAALCLASALGYYLYSTENIPERIAASDQTMLKTDSMRHTFKVALLNQRGVKTFIEAVRLEDNDKALDAIDYLSASLGFIYSGYIKSDSLIQSAVPLIRANIDLMEDRGVAISEDELQSIITNLDLISEAASKVEQSIWIDFQSDFVRFQTGEYRLQLIYKIAIVVFLVFFTLLIFVLLRQKRLIAILKDQERKLEFQAHHDALTQLPNRLLVLDRLYQAITEAKRNNQKVAVFFIDLDDFKKVNDTLGHEVGDLILMEASERLSSVVRETDTVGRLGGDEFVVVAGALKSEADSIPVAENLLRQFQTPFSVFKRECTLTASVGLSIYPNDGADASTLLSHADSAMYESKTIGKNTFCFFTREMNESISRRFEVEEQLHGALSRGELHVEYQPQVHIETGRIVSAEALLRWKSPVMGQIPPDEFIPIAEQSGLIISIGNFVLEESALFLKEMIDEIDPGFRIAVNLSPRQFRDTHLIEHLESEIYKHNIPGGQLELEITEGVLLDRHVTLNATLQKITDLNVRLSMDDFGTGYSSLSYLRNYEFDVLKIDKSFVQDIAADPADWKLVNSAIAMAHGLQLRVVAEGVETEEQLAQLRMMKCDFAQGYLFSPSVDPQTLKQMVLDKRPTDRA